MDNYKYNIYNNYMESDIETAYNVCASYINELFNGYVINADERSELDTYNDICYDAVSKIGYAC